MRIKYPDSWDQDSRDALDAMFVRALRESLWFFHGGLAGPLWFSPKELQARQEAGEFIWGAVNWTLRDPRDQLHEADKAVESAQAERHRIENKLYAAGVR